MFTFQLLAFLTVVFGLAGYALLKDMTEQDEEKDETIQARYSDDPEELLVRLHASLAKLESRKEEKLERSATSSR